VNARLVNGGTHEVLWAGGAERVLGDLFSLQGEIATSIAGAIRVTLTEPERSRLARRHVTVPQAQEAYLQGRYWLYTFNTDGTRRACDLFARAVSLDPGYALAHASLARCYLALENYTALPTAEARRLATRAATEALTLDTSLPEAHNALAEVRFKFEWDWRGAERSYLAALALNPGSSLVRSPYSRFLATQGRTDEALEQALLAAESDPLSAEMRTSVGITLYYQRRFVDAIEQYKQALSLDAGFTPAEFGLGRAYAALGRYDEAIAAVQGAMSRAGRRPNYLAELGRIHAEAGQRDRAVAILGQLLEEAARSPRLVGPHGIACIYAALGDRDAAFAWLDKEIDTRSTRILWLKVDPRVDPLRTDPRFDALVHRLGLPSS
jgi:tetratricopeptide (TPR) repeat protein